MDVKPQPFSQRIRCSSIRCRHALPSPYSSTKWLRSSTRINLGVIATASWLSTSQ
jgi:hypothetical protein